MLSTVIVCIATCSALAEDSELASLTKQLDSGSLQEKTKAARMLGEMGPAAATAVPSLVRSLVGENAGLRYEAVISLGMINSDSKQVVPALSRLLSDPLPLLQFSAIDALRKFGSKAQGSTPQLKKLLDDKEPMIAVSAARAILEIESAKGPDVAQAQSVLIAGLKSDRHDVSAEAVHGLAMIGASAVPAIQALIGGPDMQTSVNACDALAAIGPGSAKSADQLMMAAKSTDATLRWHAVSALGDIGADPKSCVQCLIGALSDSDEQVKVSAEHSLRKIGKAAVPALVEGLTDESLHSLITSIIAEIGPDAAAAVPALTGMLGSKDADVRREAILTLAAIGPAANSVAPELIKMLGDKQSPNRPAAAFALGKMMAKSAVPALKDGMNDVDNPVLRLACVWALLQIDPTNEDYATIALPQLITALDNDNPAIRREAARTLARFGARAKSAVPALQQHLSDPNAPVRREALIALAEIGPDSQIAVTDILRILNDGNPALSPIACYALGRIGAASKAAVPTLNRILQGRDPHEKTVAAWALVQIMPNKETIEIAIPLLANALNRSENPEVRVQAAQTLGKIGSSSPIAKEALKGALKDSNASVRKAAELATSQLK